MKRNMNGWFTSETGIWCLYLCMIESLGGMRGEKKVCDLTTNNIYLSVPQKEFKILLFPYPLSTFIKPSSLKKLFLIETELVFFLCFPVKLFCFFALCLVETACCFFWAFKIFKWVIYEKNVCFIIALLINLKCKT